MLYYFSFNTPTKTQYRSMLMVKVLYDRLELSKTHPQPCNIECNVFSLKSTMCKIKLRFKKTIKWGPQLNSVSEQSQLYILTKKPLLKG
jgi:hypothetical protein